ncbi:MAG: nuclear transport factor 2 family protein [Novosphingobium sp.]
MSETSLARLEAESAIRRLVGLYCDAVNRADADAAGLLFAEDCRVRIADGPEIEGRDVLVEGMRQSFGAFDFLRMQCTVAAIDVEGDRARARLLVHETTHKPGADELGELWGNYEDDYVRLPEGWRFQRRRYTLQLRALVPVTKLQPVEGVDLGFSFDP